MLDGEVFFFQAEDGIRDWSVTGVQTCALPISLARVFVSQRHTAAVAAHIVEAAGRGGILVGRDHVPDHVLADVCEMRVAAALVQIGRASCRERGEISGGAGALSKRDDERSTRV